MRHRILLLVAGLVLLGCASAAQAIVKYGTSGAEKALQSDPYDADVPTSNIEVLLRNTPPTVASGAAALAVPAAEPLPRTSVGTNPTLNVVDAPPVFEAPYLKGVKAAFII